MELAQFRTEAQRLARRSTVLKASGSGDPVAYWHGAEPGSPCISLRRKGRWLNVHLYHAAGRVEERDHPLRSSTALFAEERTSLPPVDAIFLLGSGAVETYLRTNGWAPTEPFNENFPDDVPKQYERLWQKNCPMYSNDIAAVCGGWHFPWPDGDFRDLVDSELVVWTMLSAEPWLEVFAKGDTFTVKQRVT
jgi:hypothetical protein